MKYNATIEWEDDLLHIKVDAQKVASRKELHKIIDYLSGLGDIFEEEKPIKTKIT